MKSSRWSSCAAASAIVVALAGLTRGVVDRVFVRLPPPPPLAAPPADIGAAPRVGRPPAAVVQPSHAARRALAPSDRSWASALTPRPATTAAPDGAATSALTKSAAPSIAHAPVPADHSGSIVVTCRIDPTAPGVSEALQSCIDHAPPYSAVEIPEGEYVLDHQLVVTTPHTIRTAGSADGSLTCARGAAQEHCAVLTASSTFADNYGLVFVLSTNDVRLEHIVVDGNNGSRLSSPSAVFCRNGFNTYGFNASVIDCASCALDDVLSMNALCGTGMVWSGGGATIQRSEFRDNGTANKPGLWADGLTLVYAPDSTVRANQFLDNSDVALILGYGVNSHVENNVIVQRGQPSFAGLMLDNFHSDDLSVRGDFRGAVVANNTIDCGNQLCVFGIQLGPHPWYDTRNIVGGTVVDNAVSGAKVGINVDGAGSRLAPTTVYSNDVTNVPTDTVFSGCAQPVPTDWMNVAPTSVVDRRNDAAPTGSHLSYVCQLSSGLKTEMQ
jgi:hypothetical protein